jgi:hypothetical protein
MRAIALALTLLVPAAAVAEAWEVSEVDPFGWRRALVVAGADRLAVVCPPNAAPFAVPVAGGAEAGRFTLGLEIDGERYDQAMLCSEVLCEADLSRRSWRALMAGARVTVWIDDRRGPSFPLAGSAQALHACSPGY